MVFIYKLGIIYYVIIYYIGIETALYSTCSCHCSSVVRAFAYGAMGRWIDPIELFLIPASAPRLVNKGCGMWYPVCGMMYIK